MTTIETEIIIHDVEWCINRIRAESVPERADYDKDYERVADEVANTLLHMMEALFPAAKRQEE